MTMGLSNSGIASFGVRECLIEAMIGRGYHLASDQRSFYTFLDEPGPTK